MKTALTIMLAMLVIAFVTVPVSAEDYTFVPTNGVWNEADNWSSPSGPDVPEAGDTATIPSGKT